MSTENENILRKIKKCLKLAESSNEHEAAAAMRQAQALMAKHGLNQGDVAISDIKEATSAAGALRKPAKWEAILVQLVCRAFACQSLHARRGQAAKWVFIGRDANPVIASHTFAQLYRQLKKARSEFIANQCDGQRESKASKTRKADMFCMGWNAAIYRQVHEHANTQKDEAVISAYIEKNRGTLGELSPTDRQKGRQVSAAEARAFAEGRSSAADAQLHHGINTASNAGLLETTP